MSETNLTLAQEQQKVKPKIEDVIGERLEGDRQKNALDFIAFLRENKLSPVRMDIGSYAVKHKGKSVCNIYIRDGWWMIRHRPSVLEYNDENKFMDDELTKFVLDNVNPPECKNKNCPGWTRDHVIILGKQFDKVCNCWPLRIDNPDGETLECCKKLVLGIKSFLAKMEATSKT